MDLLAPVRRLDRFQRRHPPLAITVAVLRNFSDQGAGNAAALIAYWGFFSIFPLLLVFATILGFVLHGDPSARASVEHSALKQFSIFGDHPAGLSGSGIGLAVGLLGTLWSGLGVTVAVEHAFNRIYAIPPRDQPDFLRSRWRGLKLLAVVGVLQVLSTVTAGLVSGGFGGVLLTFAGIVVSLLLNLLLFFVVFRFLISNSVRTRELWPGIVLAAFGWEILQAVGGIYVAHVVKGAGQTYGTFATVIGLLAWLYLGARILLYAAEINVVLTRRLWPRSILDPPEPADRRARAALAKMEERDDRETIDVAFHPPLDAPEREPGDAPYTVAPGPAPGEGAPPPPPAGPGVPSVGALLEAIDMRLADAEIAIPARREAREWIRAARASLEQPAGSAGSPHGAAVRALVDAAQGALGLGAAELRRATGADEQR